MSLFCVHPTATEKVLLCGKECMSFGNSALPVCSSEFSWIFIASVGFVSQALMFWCKQRIQSLLCDGCTSYKELNSYCYAWHWNDILILIKQYCHVFCTMRHSIQLILPDNVRQNHRTVVVIGRQIFDPPYHTIRLIFLQVYQAVQPVWKQCPLAFVDRKKS